MSGLSQLFLLDTNIISGLMRAPDGVIARRLAQSLQPLPQAQLGTSVVVDCELRFGLAKNPSSKLHHAYRLTMSALKLFELQSDVAQRYADLRHYLETQGRPIGPNDMLIAAHALALSATLVTDNETEFLRVPGLRVENWAR
jgi:tRNA(fMet)-specific endonuclease VapC